MENPTCSIDELENHDHDESERTKVALKEEPNESSDPLEVTGSSNDSFRFSLEKNDFHSSDLEGAERKHSSVVNELVKAVMVTLNPNIKCSDTMHQNKDNDPLQKKKHGRRKLSSLGRMTRDCRRKRKRSANETDEEREFRRLRQNMISMKQRLIKRLEMPEVYNEQQNTAVERRRMKKKRMLATETPEQAEERRRRNREQIRASRQRLREIETPEQKIERNKKKALQRKALRLMETPEQRAARLERLRIYQNRKRARQADEKPVKGKVSAKTGRIYIRERKKTNKSAEESAEKLKCVTKLDIASLEADTALSVPLQSGT